MCGERRMGGKEEIPAPNLRARLQGDAASRNIGRLRSWRREASDSVRKAEAPLVLDETLSVQKELRAGIRNGERFRRHSTLVERASIRQSVLGRADLKS